MPRSKGTGTPAMCMYCGATIDTAAAAAAYQRGEEYRCTCGRVLVKART